MPILDDIRSDLEGIKRRNEKDTRLSLDPIPVIDDPKLPNFIDQLWEAGKEFESSYYTQTSHLRPKKPYSEAKFDPPSWRKAAEGLAVGQNWGNAWNRRDESWQEERVDGEIPRKMSVRKDYITANYHEFTISPNISNVNEIFDYERKKMGWKDWVEEYTQEAITYGHGLNEVTVDYTLHPFGQVKNVVRSNARRTPEAKSFAKADGCNYVVFSETITLHQIEEDFKDIDPVALETGRGKNSYTDNSKFSKEYTHTKFYDKYRIYIDDPALEKVPFGPEEQLELAEEHQQLIDGTPVKAKKEQHHMAHVTDKLDALDRFLSMEAKTQDEELLMIPTVKAYMDNILEHMSFIKENEAETRGLRPKYPFGRYICVVGGITVRDDPNPLGVPWRKLIREVSNKRVAGRIDGAGDPEIMFSEAFQADIMRSRIEEIAILNVPKTYRHVSDLADKRTATADDNNPRKTGYFVQTPPVSIKADPPVAFMELFKLAKGNIDKDTGVNSISIGEEQPAGASGKQVQLIQRQNRTIITGELDRNLREALEDIIEADLAVMRVIYNQDRQYVINGQYQTINVAEHLGFITVKDEANQEEKVEVSQIEVNVKPGSNYPDQWEAKLNMLIQLSAQTIDPAQKIAMEAAIMDHVGIEYPEFAEGGKYRKLAEATAIGLNILAIRQQQQEAIAQEDEKRQKSIESASRQFDQTQLAPAGGGNGAVGQ